MDEFVIPMLCLENIYRRPVVQRIVVGRRRNRARFLLSKVHQHAGMSVLDVGCGTDGNSLESELSSDYTITGVDLLDPKEVHISHPRFQYFQQDARDLSRFADKQFDLAVSVGMMEHICNRAALQQIASEIDRVSQQYAIVVPWKYAWLEPHFKLPFFQLLPYPLQRELTKLFNLQNYAAFVKTDPDQFEQHFRQHYQWLSNSEWRRIFKGSHVHLNPTLETISIVKS
jgi:ubiquinone/menaquinone biosynthesis C-methylase UbiE